MLDLVPVSRKVLEDLQEHFRAGGSSGPEQDSGSGYGSQGIIALRFSEFRTGKFAGPARIACDGSAGGNLGAAAAVTSAGHCLIGWWDDPHAGNSNYAEAQGLRLAYRLVPALAVKAGERDCQADTGPLVILSDSSEVVSYVKSGREEDLLACCRSTDWDLSEELVSAARAEKASLVLSEHGSKSYGKNRSAASPLEGTAHRLAWTTFNLLCDGFDPESE